MLLEKINKEARLRACMVILIRHQVLGFVHLIETYQAIRLTATEPRDKLPQAGIPRGELGTGVPAALLAAPGALQHALEGHCEGQRQGLQLPQGPHAHDAVAGPQCHAPALVPELRHVAHAAQALVKQST